MGAEGASWASCVPGGWLMRPPHPLQSFLSVFRSLAALEKTVERCCITLNGLSSRLVVQLHCRFGARAAGWRRAPCGRQWDWGTAAETLSAPAGVRKTHNLSFQDCESLQAVFDPASCPYKLCAPAR